MTSQHMLHLLVQIELCVKFEGCVSLGSMSLLPESRGVEEKKKKVKIKKRTKTRGVPSVCSNT